MGMTETPNNIKIMNCLYRTYQKLNEKWFDGVLPDTQIFIDSKHSKRHTWDTVRLFVSQDNVCSYHVKYRLLALPADDFCAAMLHAMCHHYGLLKGVQTSSRDGTYHNRAFAEIAMAHGLYVENTYKYGLADTSASNELKEWCENNMCGFPLITSDYVALAYGTSKTNSGKPCHNHKYVCPRCGNIAYVTKRGQRLACYDCKLETGEDICFIDTTERAVDTTTDDEYSETLEDYFYMLTGENLFKEVHT